MDIFAHSLWSFLAFRNQKKKSHIYLGVLFGILPDLLSWFIYSIFLIFSGLIPYGKPNAFALPSWVQMLYNFSHSLILVGGITLVLFLCTKKFPVYILGWPLHILIDIPLHRRDYLPTPFLWPLSDWHFPGFSWGEPWFLTLNWVVLILIFSYIYIWKRKYPNKNKSKIKSKNKKLKSR